MNKLLVIAALLSACTIASATETYQMQSPSQFQGGGVSSRSMPVAENANGAYVRSTFPRPDYVINEIAEGSDARREAREFNSQHFRHKVLHAVATDKEYAADVQLVALDLEIAGHDAPAWTAAVCDQLSPVAVKSSRRLSTACGR